MDSKYLIQKIKGVMRRDPKNIEPYQDLFTVLRDTEDDNFELSHEENKRLRHDVAVAMRSCDFADTEKFYELWKKTLLFDAKYDLDSYLLYLELNRPPKERFYQPRRKVLKPLVDSIQDLVDDKLDELFLSMIPRAGKTSVLMFTMTWIIGRNSELSNLYSAYSDTITKAFYQGVLEIITDPTTYLWQDVFPTAKIMQTNSQEETINIDRRKRYASLTCRSLYGTLNGACDCNGFLFSDDLIGGIEEALNKDRMIAAWSKVDNNLLPRAKQKAKILWCGTRWSMIDPAGLRMDLLKNDPNFKNRRYKIINLPALDENDESNFDYDYGVGFDTDFFIKRRASFERNNDMASWMAQYMGEPIEREGTLFAPGDMRYYNGVLPEGEPDRVFMAIDPAWGGGDFVAAPVCYQYGDDVYIHDVVYDDRDKTFTQPLLARAITDNHVTVIQVEATKMTESYKEELDKRLKQAGIHVTITSKPAKTGKSKEQRIFDRAPDIREHFIFLEDGRRSKPYTLFMQNVYSFKVTGKNKHDDAPDSLAMAADMVFFGSRKVVPFKRPF